MVIIVYEELVCRMVFGIPELVLVIRKSRNVSLLFESFSNVGFMSTEMLIKQ